MNKRKIMHPNKPFKISETLNMLVLFIFKLMLNLTFVHDSKIEVEQQIVSKSTLSLYLRIKRIFFFLQVLTYFSVGRMVCTSNTLA